MNGLSELTDSMPTFGIGSLFLSDLDGVVNLVASLLTDGVCREGHRPQTHL